MATSDPGHGAAPPPEPRHDPVLLDRVVALLAPALTRHHTGTHPGTHADIHTGQDGAVMVDATLGLGGHTAAVLERCAPVRCIGIDRDPQALARARERLAPYGDRFVGVQATYDEIPEVLADLGLAAVDAVLFDLGVSSMQLDLPERGFAYAVDAPLDMRMDAEGEGLTAADVLNTYPVGDLTRVLRDYGEERFASRIAAAIGRRREQQPFTTSAALVELLYDAIPAPARRTGGHPAKRTFQALRMAVNDELRVLERAIPAALDAISVGGRVVVESYHSLEDRLVKRAFADGARSTAPPDLPVVPADSEPLLRLVTRGAEQADAEEAARNPRAASVRLRAAERVRPGRLRGGRTAASPRPTRHGPRRGGARP